MTANLPTIRQIQFLITLKEKGNFTQAAEACFVTQSTLSAGIKEMETILGAPVIDRSKRQIRFTPLGEDILAQGKRTIASLTDITERAKRMQKPLAWPLRLGIIPTIAPYLLPGILKPLQEAFPTLKLNVHELQSAQLVSRVSEGSLDFGLMAFPFDTKDLQQLPLVSEAFFAAVPETMFRDRTQLTLQEIEQQKLLLLSDGHCLSDHILASCNMKQMSHLQDVSATSLSTLTQLVAHGYGITLLPEMVVKQSIPDGIRILSIDETPTRMLGIVWRKNAAVEKDIMMVTLAIYRLLKGTDIFDDHCNL